MKIVQSTWVRYHHFDMARELYQMGHLERIFTSLPWWKADKESREQAIPRDLISCNFFVSGVRHLLSKTPIYTSALDGQLGVLQTKTYSRWVASNLPECDAYIAISGSGLHAGRLAKKRGAGYIMDRGSTHIGYANRVLSEEYLKWNIPREPENAWLMKNEENETYEANIITVPSDFVKKTFVDQGVNANKLRVVPYGVSLLEFFPVRKPVEDKFRLIFAGQFVLRKGVPYLLEAFKLFKHPNKELIVVGLVSDEVKEIIKKFACDSITFVGVVPRSEMKNYFSSAHALVLPSIEEGLALVQAQAMACGCPVIATPNTGSETLFTHEKEGLIIEVCNTEALVKAFTRLVDEPGLQKSMSFACLEKVKQLGGWRKYAEGIVAAAEEAKKLASSEI